MPSLDAEPAYGAIVTGGGAASVRHRCHDHVNGGGAAARPTGVPGGLVPGLRRLALGLGTFDIVLG